MTLTLIFFTPFIINIFFLIIYIITRNNKCRILFFITLLFAFIVLGCVRFIPAFGAMPGKEINFDFLLWLVSGHLFLTAIVTMIFIFSNIYRRYQDPQNYHFNHFGKKVVHSGFMSNKEMAEFILTIPVILFIGPYFAGRLIKFILNGCW